MVVVESVVVGVVESVVVALVVVAVAVKFKATWSQNTQT